MRHFWIRFANCESGATSIEYAFIASLIGLAIIASVTNIAIALNGTFANVEAPL